MVDSESGGDEARVSAIETSETRDHPPKDRRRTTSSNANPPSLNGRANLKAAATTTTAKEAPGDGAEFRTAGPSPS